MAYIVLAKNIANNDNEALLYNIAKDKNDLDCLNIIPSDYIIVEESEENFNAVKNGTKYPATYNKGVISYDDVTSYFHNKEDLQNYINQFKKKIKTFTDNDLNKTKTCWNTWDDYYNQLEELNVQLNDLEFLKDDFPMEKSLEQYFDDLGKISLSPLQIP
jgi:cell fate (sporulation/competence/biofilm development) regulator YlbF (YheA/YmcA/DUF963 family)